MRWSDALRGPLYPSLLFASSPWVDVLLLFFGSVAILIAIFGKNFTVADNEGFGFKNDKPMPTWLGKLIAAIVGTAFVLYAVTSLWSRLSR
jgi:hypothetical protein